MENYTLIEGDNIGLAIQYYTMKKEGKEVECEYLNEEGNWRHESIPDFDGAYKYRLLIPKEKKLVPFDYSDNLIGMVVETKSKKTKMLIILQDKDSVNVGDVYYTYEYLLKRFTFYPSGEPCGKED